MGSGMELIKVPLETEPHTVALVVELWKTSTDHYFHFI